MKKILCIISPFPPPYGGMAVQADKLSLALEKRGWQIYRQPVNAPFPKPIRWFTKIPIARTLMRTVILLYSLNQHLGRCDAVYLLSGFFNYFMWVSAPAILLTKIRGKRIYFSARGGAADAYFRRYSHLLKPIFSLIDAFSTPSPFLQHQFIKYFGISPSLIPNIADLNQFRFRCRRHMAMPKILCARNFETIYNVSCTIRAFASIKKHYPQAQLGLAGSGSEQKKLEALCRELNITASVTFLGQIPHHRMPDLFDEYDILLNSTNVDNLPGVILEAYASGMPVVSTATGGIPFMVEDGVTGLLVPINDFEALAKAALRIIKTPELREHLSQNAYKLCSYYSEDNAVFQLERLLFKENLSY